MATCAVTLTIDSSATAIDASHQDSSIGEIMAKTAVVVVKLGVGDEVACAWMTGLACVVGCCPYLTGVVVTFIVSQEGFVRMAGGAGVGIPESWILVRVAGGATNQSDRGYGVGMAGFAVVMEFGVVLVGDEGGRVAVGDTGCCSSSDKTTVVWGVADVFVSVTVDAGQGYGVCGPSLDNGCGY